MMKNLLLVTVDGLDYGIREEEVRSVEALRTLHRLPLAASCIAGITIRQEHAVTLADLAVCLGHAPLRRDSRGHLLVLSESEKITGFAVAGGVRRIAADQETILPLPGYLATPVTDSCVRDGETLIPIVNIAWLYTHMQRTDQDIPAPPLSVPPLREETRQEDGFRLFTVDGELFAVSARLVKSVDSVPAGIRPMRLVPQFVEGITWHDNTVLPLIDLPQRISRRRRGGEGLMVTTEIQGARFGLLVDGEEAAGERNTLSAASLPPVAASPWTKSALVNGREVIPVLDLEALLRGGGSEEPPSLPEDVYRPASAFADRFGMHDVEVVEFSLLGVRHAVPKEETGGILDFQPWRPLPETASIIAGVAALEGQLLPVLDLATVFGRQSVATPEWRLLRVKNGDFEALVMTETVFGERHITADMQRVVPIVLPHHVVYGCYPAEIAVRLILNVAALTVHFESELLQEFLPHLPEEKADFTAGLPPASRIEKPGPAAVDDSLAAAGSGVVQQELQEEGISRPLAISVSGQRTRGFVQNFNASGREPERGEQAPEEPVRADETGPVMAENAEAQTGTDESAAEVAEPSPVPATESEHHGLPAGQSGSEEPIDDPAADEKVELTRQAQGRDVTESAPILSDDRVEERGDALPEAGESGTSPAGMQPEAEKEPSLPPDGRIEAEEKAGSLSLAEESVTQTEESGSLSAGMQYAAEKEQPPADGEGEDAAAPAPPPPDDLEERLPEQPSAMPEEAGKSAEEAGTSQRTPGYDGAAVFEEPYETPSMGREEGGRSAEGEGGSPQTPGQDGATAVETPRTIISPAAERKQPTRRISVLVGIIGLVIVAVLYFFGPFDTHEADRAVKTAPRTETPAAAPVNESTGQEPLVLDVPAARKKGIDVYVVRKGDTLWDISERFTGSPWNYPRIAGENRIANPDLIFPDQRIRLREER